MRTPFFVVAITVVAALVAASSALAQPTRPSTKICAQIKGPPNEWTLPAAVAGAAGIPRTVKGTRWTVFATGVPCATAVKLAPVYLKQWVTNHGDGARIRIAGWLCAIDRSEGPSGSDGGGCVRNGLNNVQMIETGPYTIAQIRQLGLKG